jgi:hypothetical protein
MSAFTQGLMQGSQFVQQGQLNQARKNAFGAQQAALEQQGEADQLKVFQDTVNGGVAYISQIPQQERQDALRAYFVNNGQGEAFQRLAQSGMLADLSDQRLQAFQASQRQEQVLKDKEALIGRDGKPIYENRYNAPQVVASGSALVGEDGSALYTNTPPPEAPKPTATMQDYEFARQNGFQGTFLDYQRAVNESKRSPGVTVNTGDGAPELGTIPQGFQAIRGEDGNYSMQRVPGGPEDDTEARQGVIDTARDGLATIDRLLEGDLAGGLQSAFGLSGAVTRNVPGSKARDAWANIQEVVGPQTLDELAKMKGVPSDRDIDLVKGAATALNDPGISDEEAVRKLKEIKGAMDRILALPNVTAQGQSARNPLYDKYGLE